MKNEEAARACFVVGVSGGSAAGKTTVARLMADALRRFEPAVIEVDRYFLDHSHLAPRERMKLNYDVPEALDFDLLARDLAALKTGRTALIPEYVYATHTSRPGVHPVHPSRLVIVEGILLFYPAQVKPLLDFRIFVDAGRGERLRRRIARDTKERGRSRESVIRQFNETVEPGFDRYTKPTRASADMTIDWNTWNYPAIDQIARRVASRIV